MDKISILVVDDDEALREGLSDILKDKGYSVDAAGDGSVALDLIGGKNYNVVILDLKMPHVSGYEILKHIKTDFPPTRVIVMTGTPINLKTLREEHAPLPYIAEADCDVLKTADEILVKPFSIEKLISVIGEFCSEGR